MDGIKVAWCSWLAAQRFLFWTLVEATTRAIYWHKEASREQLILKPRRPKDLYDAGYVLFVWDLSSDAWRGYWRSPAHQPGMPAAEVYELVATMWGNVPFHEVEFSDMPEVTFKVRAVSLEWCRGQMPQKEAPVQPEPRLPAEATAEGYAARRKAEEEAAAARGDLTATKVEEMTEAGQERLAEAAQEVEAEKKVLH